ncbi:Membrane protein [Lutibaculum baratangense AMV1]|uniref:Membrane protein n=1 Tax=Lutibaculum baratangense AMV1 TaxID=631454 RepID=V4RMI3_9HYPH|nr:Membrane protein [Lutibaculum baratangense AMV1]
MTRSAQDQLPDRHFLNLRWLACTCLTGLAGGTLIAGALFIAADRQAQFAEAPRMAVGQAEAAFQRPSAFGSGKTDRLVVLPRRAASRQVIQESSTRSVGGKEFVNVRSYIRAGGNLALNRGDHAERAPKFDPVRIYAEVGAFSAGKADDAPATKQDDPGDENVAVAFSDLSASLAQFDEADLLSPEEVSETVRETAAFLPEGTAFAVPMIFPVGTGTAGWATAAASLGPAAAGDLVSSFGANVTTIAKSGASLPEEATDEMSVTLNAGDTLRSVLLAHGATEDEADEILAALGRGGQAPSLRPGEEVRLTIAQAGESERHRPVRVSLPSERGHPLTVALAGNGFQRMANVIAPAMLRPSQGASARQGPRANVYDALWETGAELEIPEPLVSELIHIFAFDVDFQRTTSPGDTIEVFFTDTDEDGEQAQPEILFASITTRGETHRFYRYRTPDDGEMDYYDPTGKSARKFLLRKPAPNTVFTSGFGMRRHPILGYSRMHTGVDWAARTGTPIIAAGNGKVVQAGWSSGYGQRVEIQHANGYLSTYSHMSAISVKEGQSVHQGQLIGKIGSTGRSTGPHLHYEVKVNGRFVDPMRIRLPRGRVLDGRVLAGFEKEKARIEALMNRSPASTRVASAGGA